LAKKKKAALITRPLPPTVILVISHIKQKETHTQLQSAIKINKNKYWIPLPSGNPTP